MGFNFYYLLHTHESLLIDYFSLNSCFYKNAEFASNFFNETTKQQGNFFSLISVVICIFIIRISYRKFMASRLEPKEIIRVKIPVGTALYLAGIFCFSFAAWLYGFLTIPPAYDEVFSAQQCADLPLFQTLTYYMAPNNHIGFNAINHFLFFWVDDKVLTGKIISLIAYLLWNLIAFYAFTKLSISKPISLLTTLVLALQFPVWGFAFEARGYEWVGLCEFVSVLSIIAYYKERKRYWLLLNTIVSIVGYSFLPTFMYFHAGIILFGCWKIIKTKSIDRSFWSHQFYIGAGAFLFYLPALCYSGLAAFTHNKFMLATEGSFTGIFIQTITGLPSYFNYALSDLKIGEISLGLVFALLPIIALFNKRIRNKELFVFYILLFVATLIIMLVMRRNPFHRNLIGHYYYMLFIGFYIIQVWLQQIEEYLKIREFKRNILAIILMLLFVNFGLNNPKKFNFFLYFDDLNLNYSKATEVIERIPPQSTVTFSDACFFEAYLAHKRPYKIIECNHPQADFMVINIDEEKLIDQLKNYVLYDQVNDCLIYKKTS